MYYPLLNGFKTAGCSCVGKSAIASEMPLFEQDRSFPADVLCFCWLHAKAPDFGSVATHIIEQRSNEFLPRGPVPRCPSKHEPHFCKLMCS